ncbi:MAG: M1 family aminopeptidase [Caldilineales bacterium]
MRRLLLLVISGLMLLSGCATAGRPGRAVDRWADYRAALAPDQQTLPDTLPPLPDYRMEVQLDPAQPLLTGRMTVVIPAEADGEVLPEYYFRLYPNLNYYGGGMSINLVTVNGMGAAFDYAAEDTAVRVLPPVGAIQPNQPVQIGVAWRLKLPVWDDTYYHLIGRAGGVLSLPAFYPMLAVRDAQTPTGWHLDISELQGDSAFSAAATYQVTVTAPISTVVVSSGVVTALADTTAPRFDAAAPADGRAWRAWHLVSGPAREFALFSSELYRLAETTANGIRVRSWYRPGDEAAGRAAADYAAAALRVYGELFGPYPDAELDVVAGPLEYRGMEYAGVIELGFELYQQHGDELEYRTAHEVAHQWWYNQVGNDAVNAPWLDEGLAEFSTWFYIQRVNGQAAADRLVQRRWQAAYDSIAARGLDAPVNRPVQAFGGGNYEALVYGKAALFHHALMQALGEDAYLALLQAYVQRYRFAIADAAGFMTLAEEARGSTAGAVYQQWIVGEGGE